MEIQSIAHALQVGIEAIALVIVLLYLIAALSGLFREEERS